MGRRADTNEYDVEGAFSREPGREFNVNERRRFVPNFGGDAELPKKPIRMPMAMADTSQHFGSGGRKEKKRGSSPVRKLSLWTFLAGGLIFLLPGVLPGAVLPWIMMGGGGFVFLTSGR